MIRWTLLLLDVWIGLLLDLDLYQEFAMCDFTLGSTWTVTNMYLNRVMRPQCGPCHKIGHLVHKHTIMTKLFSFETPKPIDANSLVAADMTLFVVERSLLHIQFEKILGKRHITWQSLRDKITSLSLSLGTAAYQNTLTCFVIFTCHQRADKKMTNLLWHIIVKKAIKLSYTQEPPTNSDQLKAFIRRCCYINAIISLLSSTLSSSDIYVFFL